MKFSTVFTIAAFSTAVIAVPAKDDPANPSDPRGISGPNQHGHSCHWYEHHNLQAPASCNPSQEDTKYDIENPQPCEEELKTYAKPKAEKAETYGKSKPEDEKYSKAKPEAEKAETYGKSKPEEEEKYSKAKPEAEYNAKPTSTPCLQPTSTALPENYEKPTKAYETATPKAAEEKQYKATAPEATTYAAAAGKADYSASNLESSSSKMAASLFAAAGVFAFMI